MDIAKKFGQKVKELRLAKNLSQGKLAKRLGVNASYISQIERGLGNLSLRRIEKLANALRVAIKDLLD